MTMKRNLGAIFKIVHLVLGLAIVTTPFDSATYAASVGSLTLINADTGQPIPQFNPMADQSYINLEQILADNLSIEVNASSDTQSVLFNLDSYTYIRVGRFSRI